MILEELNATETRRMKNRSDVPNLIKMQSRLAIEMEQRKLIKDKEQEKQEELWMEEIRREGERIFTQEELSEGLKKYLRATYSPDSYRREDLYPTPTRMSSEPAETSSDPPEGLKTTEGEQHKVICGENGRQ